MKKRVNLADAMNTFDRRPAEVPSFQKISRVENHSKIATALPPSRQGKKAVTGYFDPEVIRQLKRLAADEDKTIQSLMAEALNDLFKKYGRPYIA